MENRFLLNDYPPPAGMSVYPRRSAAKICLGYAAAGWLWILLSDKAVALVTHDVETMVVLNSIKGSLFVLVTAAILYFLVYAQLRQVEKSQHLYIQSVRELKKKKEALTASDEELRQQFDELTI